MKHRIEAYEFENAVNYVGEFRLKLAFQRKVFVYGTQGNGSFIVKGLKNFSNKTLSRKVNLFEPGRRGAAYLAGNFQMMDLYYGQAGTGLHLKRDPIIAEFVHHAMGFTGPFSMTVSGRDAYMKTFKTGIEGWDERSPSTHAYNTLTATKEMSRIIRWGIAKFGGTLIFEGKDVYYSQVFDKTAPRVGDTDLEARELFKYFKPNASKVPFGRGKLVFHWNGKETVPSKSHFISNWKWNQNQTHEEGNYAQDLNEQNLLPIWNNFILAPFSIGSLFNPN